MDWSYSLLLILACAGWFMSGYRYEAMRERRAWRDLARADAESSDEMLRIARDIADMSERINADYSKLRSAYVTAYRILEENDLLPGGDSDDAEPADE